MIKTIHQLPQILLARILIFFWKAKYDLTYNCIKIYRTKKSYGISLGTIIILSTGHNHRVLKHEYGHCRQSMYFGWLYLLIIGLPSITMNILTRFKILKAENYYKRWPENWADKLGDVKR